MTEFETQHAERMAKVASMMEDPMVVREIDIILREMRHEWDDLIWLRRRALDRLARPARFVRRSR